MSLEKYRGRQAQLKTSGICYRYLFNSAWISRRNPIVSRHVIFCSKFRVYFTISLNFWRVLMFEISRMNVKKRKYIFLTCRIIWLWRIYWISLWKQPYQSSELQMTFLILFTALIFLNCFSVVWYHFTWLHCKFNQMKIDIIFYETTVSYSP